VNNATGGFHNTNHNVISNREPTIQAFAETLVRETLSSPIELGIQHTHLHWRSTHIAIRSFYGHGYVSACAWLVFDFDTDIVLRRGDCNAFMKPWPSTSLWS
jgi:hypothetical protein